MIRLIKHRYRSPVSGEWAVLDCEHIAQLSEMKMVTTTQLTSHTYYKLQVFCDDCNEALLLPDTLQEIWEKYWHGRKTTRF